MRYGSWGRTAALVALGTALSLTTAHADGLVTEGAAAQLDAQTNGATQWVSLDEGAPDYAPRGLPDFDQRQAGWQTKAPTRESWTRDGPVALADAVWWLDSHLETSTQAPPLIADSVPLVPDYGAWDDHDPRNAVHLVNQITSLTVTDGPMGMYAQGTCFEDLVAGTRSLVAAAAFEGSWSITTMDVPTLDALTEAVASDRAIVLLLGMWQYHPTVDWQRIGGHYVALEGVDDRSGRVRISDPFLDVSNPSAREDLHNDAANVSHDEWFVSPSLRPGPVLRLDSYFDAVPDPALLVANFQGLNRRDCESGDLPWIDGAQLEMHIDAALLLGHESRPGTWAKEDLIDYAPSGMPDFSQCRGQWSRPGSPGQWTHSGPVALSDTLWWLDSMAEPSPRPTAEVNDGHPLVTAYPRFGPDIDDHDDENLGPLIEDIALRADTNGIASAGEHRGTKWEDLVDAASDYLEDRQLDATYDVTIAETPDAAWLVEQMSRPAGLVLQLGVWENQDGTWRRVGGHYAALAGAGLDDSGWVSLADPLADSAAFGGEGRAEPEDRSRHGCREAPREHDDAAIVSHDRYELMRVPGIAGERMALAGYFTPASFGDAAAFQGQNPAGSLADLSGTWQRGSVVMALDGALAIAPAKGSSTEPTARPSATAPAASATATSSPSPAIATPTHTSTPAPTAVSPTATPVPASPTSVPTDTAAPPGASSSPSATDLPSRTPTEEAGRAACTLLLPLLLR